MALKILKQKYQHFYPIKIKLGYFFFKNDVNIEYCNLGLASTFTRKIIN